MLFGTQFLNAILSVLIYSFFSHFWNSDNKQKIKKHNKIHSTNREIAWINYFLALSKNIIINLL